MSSLLLAARIETLKSSLAEVSNAVKIAVRFQQEIIAIRQSIEDASEALGEIDTQVALMRTMFDKKRPERAEQFLEAIEAADSFENASQHLKSVKDHLDRMRARSYSGLEGDSAPSRVTLEKSIQKTARILTRQLEVAADEKNESEAWATVLKDVTEDIPELYNDYVDLLRGLALRDTGLDDGMCAIVDELMRGVDKGKMSEWESLTVPSLEQKFSVKMAKIIRLGFGDWSLWSLPLAASQYGQLVSGDKRLDARFGEEKKAEIGSPYRTLVADAFATYAMGPAYAAAAIVLKLDPSKPTEADVSCEPERAVVILDMLGRLDKEKLGGYEQYLVLLRNAWHEALSQNDNENPVSEAREKVLISFTETMFAYIKRNAANPIAYDEEWFSPVSMWPENLLEWHLRWVAQQEAARASNDGQPDKNALEDPDEVLDVGGLDNTQRDFRHAMNVAWLCRLNNPDEVDAIQEAAYDLLHLLAEVVPRDEPPLGNEELLSFTSYPRRFVGSAKPA